MHVILPLPLPDLGLVAGRGLYGMIGTNDTLNVMNCPEEYMDIIGRFCADKKRM